MNTTNLKQPMNKEIELSNQASRIAHYLNTEEMMTMRLVSTAMRDRTTRTIIVLPYGMQCEVPVWGLNEHTMSLSSLHPRHLTLLLAADISQAVHGNYNWESLESLMQYSQLRNYPTDVLSYTGSYIFRNSFEYDFTPRETLLLNMTSQYLMIGSVHGYAPEDLNEVLNPPSVNLPGPTYTW